jgi:hypothetical protein
MHTTSIPCSLSNPYLGYVFNAISADQQMMLSQKYDKHTDLPPIRPVCMSTNSEKNKLVPSMQSGWREWNWQEKVCGAGCNMILYAGCVFQDLALRVKRRGRADTSQHYLVADKPGSTVSFQVTTAIGTIKLLYLRSATFNLGSLECWVDDDRAKSKTMHGYWTNTVNIGK